MSETGKMCLPSPRTRANSADGGGGEEKELGECQWQLAQLDELQLEQPDEPRELTDLPPLENPNREIFFFILLLLHFSQGGNGELELETMVSKTWLHFLH